MSDAFGGPPAAPFGPSGSPFQQLDTDIQQLTRAVLQVVAAINGLKANPQAVTGSRAGNAALASLLTALAAQGIIVDNTTP